MYVLGNNCILYLSYIASDVIPAMMSALVKIVIYAHAKLQYIIFTFQDIMGINNYRKK